MVSYAFLSYQTKDKQTAGKLKDVLERVGIKSFLAHEDIGVSEEWRQEILEEIAKADVFVCILSKNYLKSPWCMQESGIAAFRSELAIVPLSMDGTTPRGFLAHVQSVKIDPDNISLDTLMPAFLKHDFSLAIQILTDQLGRAGSFRDAEAKFKKIFPHIPKMNDEQIKVLLERVIENNQIYDAQDCAQKYIPQLLKSHGRLLKRKTLAFLKKNCAKYAV